MRLKKKKAIALLFRKGTRKTIGTLLFCYLPLPSLKKDQVLIAVPKKQVKKATQRNLIKRRIREAYRIQQASRTSYAPQHLLAYIYLGNQEKKSMTYASLAASISQSFLFLGGVTR